MLWPKGITAHPINDNKKVNTGASIKITTLALLGKIVSFTNNFKPSAHYGI